LGALLPIKVLKHVLNRFNITITMRAAGAPPHISWNMTNPKLAYGATTARCKVRYETRISENRLIASIFASMTTNLYGNINSLYTFTSAVDSQLRLSRLYNQNNMLDLSNDAGLTTCLFHFITRPRIHRTERYVSYENGYKYSNYHYYHEVCI